MESFFIGWFGSVLAKRGEGKGSLLVLEPPRSLAFILALVGGGAAGCKDS